MCDNDIDGTDAKQITDFGSMSWAPYEHPSGEYFIFASNKLASKTSSCSSSMRRGERAVRVTYTTASTTAGASPDGKQLAWTSSRAGGSDGQLFLAQWNHEKRCKRSEAPPKKPGKKDP